MKAISPVIATVIIVAVAIAISIAVALWLTGIVGGFTTVENLQITYAYAKQTVYNITIDNTQKNISGWSIQLRVENKGTGTATIDEVFINGVPIGQIQNTSITPPIGNGISINPGEYKEITINLPSGTFSSGQQVEIKLHTASGKEYPKMVTLP
jgi:FlaG/FlaF family flagellin (archaellin)